jgi:hypothetical protein
MVLRAVESLDSMLEGADSRDGGMRGSGIERGPELLLKRYAEARFRVNCWR